MKLRRGAGAEMGGPGGRPREKPNFAALGRAVRMLLRYRLLTARAYLFLLLSTGAMLLVPQVLQGVIDGVIQGLLGDPAAAESALYFSAFLILLFALARGLFSFAQSYTSERVGQSVAFDYRNDLYAKIQSLSFSYHDRAQTGQLMIRATDDVEKVRMFIGQGLLMAIQALIILVTSLSVLVFTSWRLTLVVLPVLPLSLVLFGFFGAKIQPMFMQLQQRLSHLNTVLQENLAGIKVVKAFVREAHEQRRFTASTDDLVVMQVQVARFFSFLFPLIFLVANLGQAAVLYWGGRQIVDGTLTLGEWQKFSLYLVFVFFPLGQLGFIISQMAQAGASAGRIYEILDAQSDVADRPDAIDLPPVQGRITFESVSLSYFGGEPILREVSLDVAPGQTVALLGATGSGKSSIINLLPRFYDATTGRVLIDGLDVRSVRLESLRSQMGIVLQDTTLFSGTIRDNIAFGRPDASHGGVEAAARAAAAHAFIMAFPNGYDTHVGERGSTLSGGQKQRIAIARTLLLDPRILILDDSTSSVDAVTEHEIQGALDRLMAGRTSFVIAQRISTARNADLILVLDAGRVVAQGTHASLLEDSALYAEIFSSQLVEDAPAVTNLPADGAPVTAASAGAIALQERESAR